MKYYVAHNNNDVFHYGKIEDGQQLDSGQPYFKEFKTEKEMKNFLKKKGVEIKDDLISVEDKE